MTTCPMCGQKIPIEGCAEHIATCQLDEETVQQMQDYIARQNITDEHVASTTTRTKIRWERGVAGQVAAHLLSDDGGHALVHCMTPGGRPRFMARPDAQWDTSIVDAPACDTFKDFQQFVTERFGDDVADSGRATHLSAAILLGGALTGCAVIGGMVADLVRGMGA